MSVLEAAIGPLMQYLLVSFGPRSENRVDRCDGLAAGKRQQQLFHPLGVCKRVRGERSDRQSVGQPFYRHVTPATTGSLRQHNLIFAELIGYIKKPIFAFIAPTLVFYKSASKYEHTFKSVERTLPR